MSNGQRPELISPIDLMVIVKDVGGICAAASLADVSRNSMSRYVRGQRRIPERALSELLSWWKPNDGSEQK